ncbi:MAG: hypothetical protein J6D02_03580 [Lachnospira sp.]|nr:hypothetical protein [Lachnospira sp.]
MALINCPECQKEISDTVKKCPKCGYKFKKKKGNKIIIPIIVVIVLIVIAVGGYFGIFYLNDDQKNRVAEYDQKIQQIMDVTYDNMDKKNLQSNLEDIQKLQEEVESLDFKTKNHLKEKNGAKEKAELVKKLITEKENDEIKVVSDLIGDIGEVTVDSNAAIKKAEEAYEKLDDELKSKVENYSDLQSARIKCDETMVENTIQLISEIGKVSLKEGDKKIRAASSAYNNLSSDAKTKVTNADDLRKASEKYNKLDKEQTEKNNVKKAKNSIKITKKYFDMNSVGGCDVYIYGTNTSGKSIDYISFTVSYYNAVGDSLSDSISHDRTKCLQYTGPIAPGASFGSGKYWSAAWYNTTTNSFKIDSVEIEYEDGTTQTVSGNYMKYIQ